jgi:hypothetical protein
MTAGDSELANSLGVDCAAPAAGTNSMAAMKQKIVMWRWPYANDTIGFRRGKALPEHVEERPIGSGLGQELVFVNHRGDGNLAVGPTFVHPYNLALAADANTLR